MQPGAPRAPGALLPQASAVVLPPGDSRRAQGLPENGHCPAQLLAAEGALAVFSLGSPRPSHCLVGTPEVLCEGYGAACAGRQFGVGDLCMWAIPAPEAGTLVLAPGASVLRRLKQEERLSPGI